MTHEPHCSDHENGFSWCIHEEAARQAVANAAIEGLTVSDETQKLLAPLSAGEVSIKDVIQDIESRHGVSAIEHLSECWSTYPSDPTDWCICPEAPFGCRCG